MILRPENNGNIWLEKETDNEHQSLDHSFLVVQETLPSLPSPKISIVKCLHFLCGEREMTAERRNLLTCIGQYLIPSLATGLSIAVSAGLGRVGWGTRGIPPTLHRLNTDIPVIANQTTKQTQAAICKLYGNKITKLLENSPSNYWKCEIARSKPFLFPIGKFFKFKLRELWLKWSKFLALFIWKPW